MGPVIWGIIVAVIIAIWLLLSFTFEPIGKFVRKIWHNIFGGDE